MCKYLYFAHFAHAHSGCKLSMKKYLMCKYYIFTIFVHAHSGCFVNFLGRITARYDYMYLKYRNFNIMVDNIEKYVFYVS